MKFTAEKNELYETITNASKACATKSALNILDGVLLTLENNTLTVTGYDLEIGIKVSMTVNGDEDGKIVADPKLLSEMTKKMQGDMIDVTLIDNKLLKVTSGKSTLSIPCRSGSDFPNIIETKKENTFEISEKLLKDMFLRVNYAVSRTKPELEAIKMEIEDNVFYTVATDANRLAAKHCTVENENMDIIIPDKAVSSLLRVLTDDEKSEEKVNISIEKNQISISKPNYVLISRLLENNFVQYKRILTAPFNRTMLINVKELALSMERCLFLQSDKLKIPATCTFEDSCMKINCKTPHGAIDDELEYKPKEGDFADFSINFNPRFMLEALQKTTTEEILVSFESSIKPIMITPPDNNGEFMFIIVPIRST
ncbi:MAG: DNA polymerase III subunit beta [Oscillospiraceae bacterium]|nr:DNA polymerase III subunit beta [Oscillospiraceae bacterium]